MTDTRMSVTIDAIENGIVTAAETVTEIESAETGAGTRCAERMERKN
jgi:hypothetical protein